jgi:hypothetical protein
MHPCACGSGKWIANNGDGRCIACRIPPLSKTRKARRTVSRNANRVEQAARYLDCGPQAWDDKD